MISDTAFGTSTGSGMGFIFDKPESPLAATIDELVGLRSSIILAARFAESENQAVERRGELRARLVVLRRQYTEKLDEIAMTLSAQEAIRAKEEVEQSAMVRREFLTA
jgi:hypothetical protein